MRVFSGVGCPGDEPDLEDLWSASERSLGPVLFLVGWIALGIFVIQGQRKDRDTFRLEQALLEQSLAEDRVEVARYQATAAVTVFFEERWQVDCGWLLDVGGGELLYLGGIAAFPSYAGNRGPEHWFRDPLVSEHRHLFRPRSVR